MTIIQYRGTKMDNLGNTEYKEIYQRNLNHILLFTYRVIFRNVQEV